MTTTLEQTMLAVVRLLIVALLLQVPWLGWGAVLSPDRPELTIRLYDYADVQPVVLRRAQRETAKVYHQAGVNVRWLHCPTGARGHFSKCATAADGPAHVVLNLVPEDMAQRYGLHNQIMGFALLGEPGEFAKRGHVFVDRARAASYGHIEAEATLLGHVMAHEVGHLLLGKGSPRKGSLMYCSWNAAQLGHSLRGTLHFSASEAQRVRRHVCERVRAAQYPRERELTMARE